MHLRFKIFVGEPEDGRGPVLAMVSKLGQIKIEPSHASLHNGITQPSEGHVKPRPRSSSGSPTKIESRFIIRKVHFHSLRETKRKSWLV